ncbi:MAG: hypothetical protein AAB544_04565 [Patescibacteria group bacterium]
MEYERKVTTREFLRNFRKIKQDLRAGRVHVVQVAIGDGEQLRVTSEKSGKTCGELVRAVREMRHPIHIKRTHIFDELLRPRKLR